ncbi:polysaccharide deacetylase family protein [Nocardiopsis kunsanensis]|uniref:polysaccharide deacetylase family protein n=1 Tax=Nocardiopsis kunsanensis TaxID=141693 RepID=UPI001EF9F0EE|nr:polysaccharide deacetylase family protein [Nocardiopsis kunsanensis]
MNVTRPIPKFGFAATFLLVALAGMLLAGPGAATADTSGAAGTAQRTDGVQLTEGAPDQDGEQQGPDCSVDRCIALTFDDGPGEHTGRLLDTLDAHGARATFYVLGSKVTDAPGTVERMADEGHEVGNHTWDHPDLTELSQEEIRSELGRTDKAIAAATGSRPKTVRPPYGALDGTVRESVTQPLLLWDVDTLDWQSLDADAVTDAAVEGATEGSVVLFHDIHESTVEAIPHVLRELSAQGYTFVTVGELFDAQDMEPGSAYSDARLR